MSMSFTPVIAVHTTFALSAVALGPLALWTRLGQTTRPRWHRGLGYAWVTCMVGTAISALFIRSTLAWSFGGFSPIHLLIAVTLVGMTRALVYLQQGNIQGHRKTMQSIYLLACIVTGFFTLLPQRLLGQLIWRQWLGWS